MGEQTRDVSYAQDLLDFLTKLNLSLNINNNKC